MMTRNKSRFTVGRAIPRLAALVFGSALGLTQAAPAHANPGEQMNQPVPVDLNPVVDKWTAAMERWWDIGNNQFNGFVGKSQEFNYYGIYSNPERATHVTLTYDAAPNLTHFRGHIDATGLKPNFAYQIKLMGKHEKGVAGWGSSGSDWSNETIGKIGRWFCNGPHDSTNTETNYTDAHYDTYYKNQTDDTKKHDINGYLFSGVFVTDKFGNASVDFTSQNNYHITFQSDQLSQFERDAYPVAGTWPVQGGMTQSIPTTYYGYGSTAPSQSVTLYYQWEDRNSGQSVARPRIVKLPAGTYRCRFVFTEESFHNNPDGGNNGGRWKTVLGTEDLQDTNPFNDIVFTIPASGLSAAVSNGQINLAWPNSTGVESYNVKRSTTAGGPYETIATGVTATASTVNYTDNSVIEGIRYYYVVSAITASAGLESANSNEVNALVTPPLPTPPTSLSAAPASKTQINLTWLDQSANETGFQIERSTNNKIWAQITPSAGANVTSYANTGLKANTTYYYRVRAYNSAGNSAYSNVASAKTPR